MRIVIVEDEKPAARRLVRLIENLGFNVEMTLHSVSEAVDWFLNHKNPDLILLDIQLSDGLSFEIFDEVFIESPIIFTTAYDEYALKAYELDVMDYLLKPIGIDDLKKALDKYSKLILPKKKNQISELSELYNLPKEDIAKITTHNSTDVFKI